MIIVDPRSKSPEEMSEDIKALAAFLGAVVLASPRLADKVAESIEKLMPDAAPRVQDWVERMKASARKVYGDAFGLHHEDEDGER